MVNSSPKRQRGVIDVILKFEPLGRLPAHADIANPHKIAGFLNIDETGDPSDKCIFYVKHNKTWRCTIALARKNATRH